MGRYDNLYSLIESIETLMDGLLISGLSVINNDTLKVIEQSAASCAEAGLGFAADTLKELLESQEKKRHDITYNNRESFSKYFILNEYIAIIKSRLNLEKARENIEDIEGGIL